MVRTSILALLLALPAGARPQGPPAAAPARLADGVYAVLRDGTAEKDVLPLRAGEALAVDRHPFAKPADAGPPRYLAVRAAPDVALDVAAEPEARRQGRELVSVRIKLRPAAATALARLTRDPAARQVAVVVGGEVATVHKVRAAIESGEIEVTSCAPGGADHLLKQLQSRHKEK